VLLILFNTWSTGCGTPWKVPGQRGGIEFECINSWIYWVLQRCLLTSLLERWNCGAYLQTILAWYRFLRHGSLKSPISIIMTWCPLHKFLHKPHSRAPQKFFQSCPELAKTGPVSNVSRNFFLWWGGAKRASSTLGEMDLSARSQTLI